MEEEEQITHNITLDEDDLDPENGTSTSLFNRDPWRTHARRFTSDL